MVQQMMAHLQGQKNAEHAAAQAPPVKQVRKTQRKKEPEYIEPESDSGESSSSYESYASLEEIHKKFDDEPCEYISPAKLREHSSKKEAVQYLASKACPKIPTLKKKAMHQGVPHVVAAPESTPVAKKVRKVKAAAPEPAPEVAPSPPAPKPRTKKVKAPVEVAPVAAPAPAAAAPKAKRPASEYAKLVGKYRKEKMSFADASKRAKAECDAKKKKD
jgi:hypothetical protein